MPRKMLSSYLHLPFVFRERAAKRVAGAGFFCDRIGFGMTVEGPPDISGLLAAWGNGDEEALQRLMSFVYPELRRIARRYLGRRPYGHTLESASLANEAYL